MGQTEEEAKQKLIARYEERAKPRNHKFLLGYLSELSSFYPLIHKGGPAGVNGWTRSDKIAALSLVVGILSAIAAWLAVPIFRQEVAKNDAGPPTSQVASSPVQTGNPKPSQAQAKASQEPRQTPEQDRPEPVKVKNHLLRFDGLYVRYPDREVWLKFYENGTVVSVSGSAGNVHEAKNKLDMADSDWNTKYEVSGNQISFTYEVGSGEDKAFNRFSGYISSEKLTLTYTGPWLYGTSDWIFVSFP